MKPRGVNPSYFKVKTMADKRYARLEQLLDENKQFFVDMMVMWDAPLDDIITEIFETGLNIHKGILEIMQQDEQENVYDREESEDE